MPAWFGRKGLQRNVLYRAVRDKVAAKGRWPSRPTTPQFEELERRLVPAAPVVLSINRTSPLTQFTNANTVAYAVTFDQPVTGVNANAFQVSADSTLGFSNPIVAGSGAAYTVSIDKIVGTGALRLDLIDKDSIVSDPQGLPLGGAGASNGSFQGQPFSFSLNSRSIAPFVQSINRTAPASAVTTANALTFTIAFSEPVTGVDLADFQIVKTNSAAGTISQVTAVSASSFNVTVSGVTGIGEIGIRLVDNGSIRDADGNPLVNHDAAFLDQSTWAAGSTPTATAAADMNGDGSIDLVVTNSAPKTVSLLLNNGNATFKPAASFPVLQQGERMIVADINGDGRLDVLSFDRSAPFITTFLGNGDASFRPALTSAALAPAGVAAADVNSDGKADLVIAEFNSSGRAGVKLGNGDGTFRPETTFATVANAYNVSLSDFNGDGKPDLAITSDSAPFVSVLLGNGDGGFQGQRTFATGPAPQTIGIADLNGDGKADLVIPNKGTTATSLLFGNGDGTFKPASSVAAGNSPRDVAISDFNRDGALDLVIGNELSDNASVLLGNGDGTYQPQLTYAMGARPRSIVVADLNGNGRPDFATGNVDSSTVSLSLAASVSAASPTYLVKPLLPAAGPHVVSLEQTSPANSPTNATAVTYTVVFSEPVTGVDASDFQVTGLSGSIASITALDAATYTVAITGINGSGTLGLNLIDNGSIRDADNRSLFSNAPAFASQVSYSVVTEPLIATADVNGDGKLDLATANPREQAVRILLGNGDGTFQASGAIGLGHTPRSIEFADINGDGKPDVVTGVYYGSGITILFGNGDGTFKPGVDTYSGGPSAIAVGDVNRDGKADIAVTGNSSSGDVGILLGNGDGTFKPRISLPAGVYPRWVGLADFNGDGKLDVAMSGDEHAVGIMLGNGNGTFAPRTLWASGPETKTGTIADFNNDGKPDIAIQEYFSAQNVLINSGAGSFKPYVSYPTGMGGFRSITSADINGDGFMDLVAASNYSSAVAVRIGNGDGTFLSAATFATAQGPLKVVVGDFNGDGRPDIATSNNGFSGGTVSVLLNKNGSFTGQATVIDQTKPTAAITAQPNAATNSRSANFSFTGADPPFGGIASGVNHFEYQLDAGGFTAASSPLSLTNLAEGSHTFRVRAVDNAGNTSALETYTWVVDLTAPVTTISAPPPSVTFGTTTVSFTGTDAVSSGVASGINRFAYRLDNGGFQTAVSPLTLANLTSGNHTVFIHAIDNAGNVGPDASTSWLVDLFPPIVQSINRLDPASTPTSAAAVIYQVTFNKPVTGVDASDFAVALVTATAAPVVSVTAINGNVYNVTVTNIAGAGTLALNLVDDGSIRDAMNAPLAPANAPATFQAPQTYSAGAFPRGAAFADLNADGKLDLIVANSSAGSVSILLGNGNGTFQGQQTFAADVHPESIAIGDLNADGKPDLTIGSSSGSAVSVLLGNGNGTFQSASQWTSGLDPYAVSVGDLNGDNRPDIAVANKSDKSVSVLLGNGNGAFQTPLTFAAGIQPAALVLGDFNADGKLDLAIANSGSSTLGVLLGNGNGTFQSQLTFATGSGPISLALADFDVDGKLDVAIANSTDNTVSVLLGNGDGLFKPQRTFAAMSTPVSLAVGNLNGDRKPDLAIANLNGQVSVLLGNGDGAFSPQTTFASGNAPVAVTVGDVSGDGRADLASVNVFDGTASVFINALNGNFFGQGYTIDRIAPTTTITASPAAATNATAASFSFTSADTTVGGVTSGVDHSEYQLDGGGFTTTTNPRNLVGLSQGSHTFQVRAVDNLGNVGDPASFTWTIDTTGPTSLITAQPPAFTTGTSASFSFSAADPLAGGVSTGVNHIEVRLDNAAFTTATSPASFANLSLGAHTLSVRAIDNVGNSGAATNYTWTIDQSAPIAPTITRGAPAAANTNAPTATFAVAFNEGVTGVDTSDFTITASGVTTTTPLVVTPVSASLYNVTVNGITGDGTLGLIFVNDGSVHDLAGNALTGSSVAGQTYTIDQTAPTLVISPDGTTLTSTPTTFTFTFSEPVTGFSASGIGITNGAAGAFTAVNNSTYTLVVTPLANGAMTVSVADGKALDVAGNVNRAASALVNFAITNVATATTLTATPTATTGGTLVTFKATIAPSPGNLGAVSFKDNGTVLPGAASVAVSNGIASFTTSALIAGNHALTAEYSGALGYAASSSSTLNFTVTRAATVTTLATTPNTALPTQPVILTVNVAGGAPTSGETVTIIDVSNANAPVATTGGVLAGGSATLTVAPGALAVGAHSLVAVYGGNAFNAGSQSNPVPLVIATAPQIVSVALNGGIPSLAGAQHSRIANLVVHFDQAVQLDANALTLALHTKNVSYGGTAKPTGMGAIPTLAFAASADNKSITVTFSGTNTEVGPDQLASLVDGVYDLQVDATKVHPAGNPGINMANSSTTTFHRLFGDTGDATGTPNGVNTDYVAIVNSGDNLQFRAAFNNAAGYKAFLDFNGDGTINSGDNLQFRSRFNKPLAWSV